MTHQDKPIVRELPKTGDYDRVIIRWQDRAEIVAAKGVERLAELVTRKVRA